MSIYKLNPKQGEFKPVLVAIEKATNNEFFVIGEGLKVNGLDCIKIKYPGPHPSIDAINSVVYKRGFSFKRVDNMYKLKPLK